MTLSHISKHYAEIAVLDKLDLQVKEGDFLAISGASGSGKTTLLGIIGLLDTADTGTYQLRERPVSELDDSQRSRLRNQTFGFIFQQFSLIPNLNAWQNVARPLTYARIPRRERKARAMVLLEQLGLADRATHRPAQLSGGQQQRVAIARALINDPDIILADEPTGNLPKTQWGPIFDTFDILHRAGKIIIVVTHNPEVASRATQTLHLAHGKLSPAEDAKVGQVEPHSPAKQSFLRRGSAPLELHFLGGLEVVYQGKALSITPRQADLLTLMSRHPEGLSGEQLLLLAYGEEGKMSTLKAALSKLRQRVPIASRPYRIDDAYHADFLQIETFIKEDNLKEALEVYHGSLLSTSNAPGVIEFRDHLDESLRQAVLSAMDADAVFTLAEQLDEDLELWETALNLLAPDDPRRAIAQSKVAQIRKTW